MTRNWLIGATTSAVLHGGAAVMFLASATVPQGAPIPVEQPRAITVELINAPSRQAGKSLKSDEVLSATDRFEQTSPAPTTPSLGLSAATQASAVAGGEAQASVAAPDPGAVSDYYRRVETHLARFHAYPAALASARPNGVVRVGVIVRRDGRVMDAWIETSSGVVPLDEAALQTLRRAEPLPVLPATLPGAIDLIVPLRYAANTRAEG